MKMTFQPKKKSRSRVHGFRKRRVLLTEERFFPEEEQKEEKNCPLNMYYA